MVPLFGICSDLACVREPAPDQIALLRERARKAQEISQKYGYDFKEVKGGKRFFGNLEAYMESVEKGVLTESLRNGLYYGFLSFQESFGEHLKERPDVEDDS